MKSLLTLDLAAMVPSPSIAVKKSLSLLRAIGLSAGLVASTASMMEPAQAATSGTIRATGTVPNTCSVSGAADIAMVKLGSGGDVYLEGSAVNIPYSNSGATEISIARPTLSGPTAYTATGDGAVYALVNNEIVAFGTVKGFLRKFIVPEASSGTFTYLATVNGGPYVDGNTILPGNYELSTTITCVVN